MQLSYNALRLALFISLISIASNASPAALSTARPSFSAEPSSSFPPSSTLQPSSASTKPPISSFSQNATSQSISSSIVTITPSSSQTQTSVSASSTTSDLPSASPVAGCSTIWKNRNGLYSNNSVSTGIPPSLVNHDGLLYLLYTDKSTNNLNYVIGNNDAWGSAVPFIDEKNQTYTVTNTQAPALASFLGNLHGVIQQNGSLIHFIFNDTTSAWICQSVVSTNHSTATLTAYDGELYIAMLANSGNKLDFAHWGPDNGWSSITNANGESSWGLPGMYVQNDTLYMLFPTNDSGRKIISLIYNSANQTWSRITPPNESTAFGVTSTYGEDLAFMGFQSNNGNANVFVSVYNNSWAGHETTCQSSSDTPSMAVLDGVVNLVFNSHDSHKNILWIQRPLMSYSLESWMSVLNDSRPISSLSIPGTHDSAAVSILELVECQTMSITEQLNAGIRYLDLRAGLEDNVLYMYHGPYQINPPFGLKFSKVIGDVQSWLSSHPTEAVIVQVKQDHSPDNSTISFASAVSQVVNQTASSWNLSSTLPNLGDIRGKMQLVRRFPVNQTAGEQPIGIDVSSGWKDNNPHFEIFTPSGVHFVLQDEYQFDEDLSDIVRDKFSVVNTLLDEAANNTDPTTWYLNFASATHKLNFDGLGINPREIAIGAWELFTFVDGVNDHLRNELYGLPTGQRYGTILMDFPESPDDDLIARIVVNNM